LIEEELLIISVNFHGPHRVVTRIGEMEISLSDGTCVDHALAAVRERFPALPLQMEDLLITVNDKVSTVDQLLKEKDNISLLPHMGGG